MIETIEIAPAMTARSLAKFLVQQESSFLHLVEGTIDPMWEIDEEVLKTLIYEHLST